MMRVMLCVFHLAGSVRGLLSVPPVAWQPTQPAIRPCRNGGPRAAVLMQFGGSKLPVQIEALLEPTVDRAATVPMWKAFRKVYGSEKAAIWLTRTSQGPPYCTYGLRVPASCVLYVRVPCTVAIQAAIAAAEKNVIPILSFINTEANIRENWQVLQEKFDKDEASAWLPLERWCWPPPSHLALTHGLPPPPSVDGALTGFRPTGVDNAATQGSTLSPRAWALRPHTCHTLAGDIVTKNPGILANKAGDLRSSSPGEIRSSMAFVTAFDDVPPEIRALIPPATAIFIVTSIATRIYQCQGGICG